MTDWQSMMRSIIENFLIRVGTMRTINEKIIFRENLEDE